MRRWLILLAAALLLLTMHAKCAELPSEVERALREEPRSFWRMWSSPRGPVLWGRDWPAFGR